MKATITDIARLVGVSHGCVSRVLRGVPISVSEETRNQIVETAKKLNYTPNYYAQALKSGRHNAIGVIAYNIGDAFAVDCIKAMESYLDANTDYRALWMSCSVTDKQTAKPEQILYEAAQYVDGLIIISAMSRLKDAAILRFWAERHLPMVTVIRLIPGDIIPAVAMDEPRGTRLLVEHLIELGHKRIGFCYRENAANPYATLRFETFKKVIIEYGLEVDESLYAPVDGTPESGYAAGERLLKLKVRPSAIIGFNDLVAFGLIRACFDAGLSIPNDISIAGHDDIHMAKVVTPPLTTVAADFAELSCISIEKLLEAIETPDEERPVEQILTEPKLMVRQSTGKMIKE